MRASSSGDSTCSRLTASSPDRHAPCTSVSAGTSGASSGSAVRTLLFIRSVTAPTARAADERRPRPPLSGLEESEASAGEVPARSTNESGSAPPGWHAMAMPVAASLTGVSAQKHSYE